jgi:hypothetical protein
MSGGRWLPWVACLVATARPVFAMADQPPAPASATPPVGQLLTFGPNQIAGRLEAVDVASKMVVIRHEATTRRFKLNDSTTVFVEGRLGSPSDVRAGTDVRAAFQTRAGEAILRWIEVLPVAKPAVPGKPNQ